MIATKLQRQTLTLALALLGACTGGESGEGEAPIERAAETRPEALSDAARFDKDMRKKGCEILTAELVGRTFDVPAADLRQMKMLGCSYSWSDEAREVEASLMMITAHGSEAAAARWFEGATASKTVEEVAADLETTRARLEESDRLKSDSQKQTADAILDMLPKDAIVFEDVPGVGDEARVSQDGTLYVRVDNLTFQVRGYSGDKAPPIELEGPFDAKKMIEASKANAAAWAERTAPKRKADGAKLAKAIVDAL